MNSKAVYIILRFIGLCLMQVLVFNPMTINYVTLHISLLFVLFFPLRQNKTFLLVGTFVFGLCLDIFSNSGGIQTAALLTAASCRHGLIRIILGNTDLDYQLFSLKNYNVANRTIFIFSICILHYLVLFTYSYFSPSHTLEIIYKSIINSIFTTVFLLLMVTLFSEQKK